MTLTGEKLEQIGIALYGAHWPSVMAKRLHKSRRTIFNKRNAEEGVDAKFCGQLLSLVDAQAKLIEDLRKELTEEAKVVAA